MIRLVIYLLLIVSLIYLLWSWGSRQTLSSPKEGAGAAPKLKNRFRAKVNPSEVWVQVYETASLDEARMLQARLEEEEIECVLYEQGRKDIHGNPMPGIGVAVPKTAVPHSQNIISRMPV